ncbi:MAG: hypothetical protein HN742_20210 [Lentisphaerae bacterium]|jgi:streptogramin lyase|nr:hypothetical protein [Lentisphaerota bacterium]MBT4815603.1 hypothetical protein [Lentisphaerota bacterium]MBT5604939.1 hypothetical protein [Lentisphaerota bacterium]MBT7054533.1 hypothetical protein [Lentisphaerota bacterium]MBT7844216.1 hypothetical protein [Lentisphaerota bacterium]
MEWVRSLRLNAACWESKAAVFIALVIVQANVVHGGVVHSCEELTTVSVADTGGLAATKVEVATDAAHVGEGKGSLHLSSVSGVEPKVVYISMDLSVPATDLGDRALVFDAWTSDAVVTRAFYVRGYDAQGRCLLSWMSWSGLLATSKREFALIPGTGASGMKWEPQKITAPDLSALAKLRFYVGTKSADSLCDLYLDNVRVESADSVRRRLLAKGRATGIVDTASFTDHGVGGRIAELRGFVATRAPDGRNLVIATATDRGDTGYVLVTDIDSGQTQQVFCPADVRQEDPFGALLASSGKFYHGQGPVLLEFDPATSEWTYKGTPSKSVGVYLCFTEGPDGTVWAGGVYQTTLISFDPQNGAVKDHGRMDPEEKYLQFLATDTAGWVYAGIGTARCNLIAYNPSTGEKRTLIPDSVRVHGSGRVFPGADGAAYGTAAGQMYRLSGGTAVKIKKADAAGRRRVLDIKYGGKIRDFPDGRRVTGYDLESRTITIRDKAGGEASTLQVEYETEGAPITSLDAGPEGIVYGSTCHPMHLFALDTGAGVLTDMGPIPTVGGGNFCAITHQGNSVIGAEYAGGRLWAYDVTKPWHTGRRRVSLEIIPSRLMKVGSIDNGHLSHLESHDIVFIHGDAWGAEAAFTLSAPAAGDYRLYAAPYQHHNYCTVRWFLDGSELGQPYPANSETTQPGQVQCFGPMPLEAGDHILSVRMVDTDAEGARPFFGLGGLELTRKERQPETIIRDANPRILAQWRSDICRPRTALAHPDGVHVMMAGFAGYGLCGGGIGIHNLGTGAEQLLTADRDLLPGHSCITLKALSTGDLVGGTSVSAPGGGRTTATEAELFILDWRTKKMLHHMVPVPGEGNIISIQVHRDGKVFGLTGNATLFVFDPRKREVVFRRRLAECGSVPRHALQLAPGGQLYAMFSDAIARISPETFEHHVFTSTPVKITAGGACMDSVLYFGCGSHVWSYRLPGSDKR